MKRKIIIPPTGLLPHRPYSPGVVAGRHLYVSGHTGSDPVTRDIANGVEAQTRQAFDNIRAVVETAGGTMSDVVKVNIFMIDMNRDFEAMNAVFRKVFPKNPPARTTVGVSHLARPGLYLEIEVVAVLDDEAGAQR
ncbi:RidA family protein [Variovorax sp. VNK109]|uniref:RidA family protein n=1 Tax=Variovorax sp. VNK109 TaxID=3400919 RepID=UPI003C00E263